jgi:hypothetical protein
MASNDPRAFIAFDFDHDETLKMLFLGQRHLSASPFSIQDWSSKTALPQHQWEAIIHDKINLCNLLIVLVGKHMSSATGIAKEIAFAHKHDVPVFGVYIDGADEYSYLPAGLQRNRTISWTWRGISSAIDQMMREGKNRYR